MKVFCAPDVNAYRDLALDALDRRFADLGRTPAQAAMDAVKIGEARRVQDGAESALLAREAELRGLEVETLAAQVLGNHDLTITRELKRVRLKEEIRAQTTHAAIAAILAREAIPFTVPGGAALSQ